MIKYGIITHYFFYGSCQALFDYLNKKKIYNVLMIEIPLDFPKDFFKKEILINNNNKKKKIKIFSFNNKILNYLIQFIYSFYFQFKFFKNADHVISCNPFNCLITIMLKKIIFIKKISYFSIDYSSNRFSSFLLNKLYLYIDLFCYNFSDENLDISRAMFRARKKNFPKLNTKNIKKKIKIVPHGIWNSYKKSSRIKKCLKLAYIGDINERTGSRDIIDYVSLLEKKNYILYYVGIGELLADIKNDVKKLRLENNVKFINWVDQKNLMKILNNIDFGFAPYKNLEHNKNAYPSKVITFLSFSIPVFTTNYNHICKKVINSKAGLLLSKKNFKKNFNRILLNPNFKKKLMHNAFKFSEQYKWQNIFKKSLNL
jgi:glycosyltransferase involved in cell wall biosynthesis